MIYRSIVSPLLSEQSEFKQCNPFSLETAWLYSFLLPFSDFCVQKGHVQSILH